MQEEYAESGELAATFFFTNSQETADRHDLFNFIPSIVYQLSIRVPETKALMEKAFEHDPSIPDQSCAHQFKKLVVEPLLALGEAVSRKIVVVDGLDQYKREHWVDDLIFLLIYACRHVRLPLRFYLSSRMKVPTLNTDAIKRSQCRPYSLTFRDIDICSFIQEQLLRVVQLDLDQLVAKSPGSSKSTSEFFESVDLEGVSRRVPQMTSPSNGHQPIATSSRSHEVRPLVSVVAKPLVSI